MPLSCQAVTQAMHGNIKIFGHFQWWKELCCIIFWKKSTNFFVRCWGLFYKNSSNSFDILIYSSRKTKTATKHTTQKGHATFSYCSVIHETLRKFNTSTRRWKSHFTLQYYYVVAELAGNWGGPPPTAYPKKREARNPA